MRRINLALAFLASFFAAMPAASAQGSPIDLSRFDIVGLKLGQSMEDAVAALKKYNPKLTIEIRRVGLEKWDNQSGCYEEAARPAPGGPFGPLPSPCGNWSDGMQVGPKDTEEQKKIRPDHSLIAGVIAYHDERQFGPPRKGYPDPIRDVTRAGEETIHLVMTPESGKERVTMISRAKSYPAESVGFDDLKDQIAARYAAPATVVDSYLNTSPKTIIFLNLFIGNVPLTKNRDLNAFLHCSSVAFYEYHPGDRDFILLQPPRPNRIGQGCGSVIRAHVRSFHDNVRFAHGFSVVWLDQDALFKLSRDRILVAKALRDKQFRPSGPKAGEKF